MTWLLVLGGILLLVLGLWGGPAASEAPERHSSPPANEQAPAAAWDVIARPIEREELIQIPDHRPWYMPGKDRRFLQGLLVGLGSGLMVTAIAVGLFPRTVAQPPKVTVNDSPKVSVPKVEEPAPTPPPTAATEPEKPAVEQPPVTPANITFVVEEGDMAPTIAAKLKAAGLIADVDAFLLRVAERGVDTRLKAGTFVIPTNAQLDVVIDALIA